MVARGRQTETLLSQSPGQKFWTLFASHCSDLISAVQYDTHLRPEEVRSETNFTDEDQPDHSLPGLRGGHCCGCIPGCLTAYLCQLWL